MADLDRLVLLVAHKATVVMPEDPADWRVLAATYDIVGRAPGSTRRFSSHREVSGVTDLNLAPGQLLDRFLTDLPAPRTIITLGFLITFGLLLVAYRLLSEWQRRMTFDRILTRAPGGSVIIQSKGAAGPAMWIWVDAGAHPAPFALSPMHIIVQTRRTLPIPSDG